MSSLMIPAVRRFFHSAITLGAIQVVALMFFSAPAEASRCPAPGNYCYDAVCSAGCKTKDCNGTGNCSGNEAYKCYDCA